MFTGLVETSTPIVHFEKSAGLLKLALKRPDFFSDVEIGHSIMVNGLCLTVDNLTDSTLGFTLAAESLKILADSLESSFLKYPAHLERSLRFGDRIHGHLVTGHVEGLAILQSREEVGGSLVLGLSVQKEFQPFLQKKGSVSLHGVSLTINEVWDLGFSVCLIPETLKITKLGLIQIGEKLTIESDYFLKMTRHLMMNEGWKP